MEFLIFSILCKGLTKYRKIHFKFENRSLYGFKIYLNLLQRFNRKKGLPTAIYAI